MSNERQKLRQYGDLCPSGTKGFVNSVRIRREAQGYLIVADFDATSFDDVLFGQLGIELPDMLRVSVPKRRAEFLAGRYAARLGQRLLGNDDDVKVGAGRVPIWPDGICGSISHTTGRCASLVLPRNLGAPGIDIELISDGRSQKSIIQVALDLQERMLIKAAADINVLATLCFSAKETLFKALYPTVLRYFDFNCARLEALPTNGSITLTLTEPLHATLPKGKCFDINFEVSPPYVLTWMVD